MKIFWDIQCLRRFAKQRSKLKTILEEVLKGKEKKRDAARYMGSKSD